MNELYHPANVTIRGRRQKLVSVQDVAKVLRVTKPTVVRLVEAGMVRSRPEGWVFWLPEPDFVVGGAWAWLPSSVEGRSRLIVKAKAEGRKLTMEFAQMKARSARVGAARRKRRLAHDEAEQPTVKGIANVLGEPDDE